MPRERTTGREGKSAGAEMDRRRVEEGGKRELGQTGWLCKRNIVNRLQNKYKNF